MHRLFTFAALTGVGNQLVQADVPAEMVTRSIRKDANDQAEI